MASTRAGRLNTAAVAGFTLLLTLLPPTKRMRPTPGYPELAVQRMLNPYRVMRWVWLGRITIGLAILLAAVFVWEKAEPADTLVATLAFATAILATVASAMYQEIYRRPTGIAFFFIQCCIDLLLVTAIVHITGGWSSQFAALYILVIAVAALLLPFRYGLAVAALASTLYSLDVLWLRLETPALAIWVQVAVFAVVSLGSGFIAARLRQAGDGREALAARLLTVQMEAADILRSIQSGIITVDSAGVLLFANQSASELLAMSLQEMTGKPILHTLKNIAPELADVLVSTAKDGQRRTRVEGRIHRQGQSVIVGLTTTMAERHGSRGGRTATAIFQDISDSKRLQAMHVRNERLQAVAELSASLAHEIRNPLASIRSANEQLAKRHEKSGLHDEDEQALLALTLRESDRLNRLLTEFLDFARTRTAVLERLSVNSLVDSAVSLVRQHPACGTNAQIVVEHSVHDMQMEGDEDLLHRAVFNLLLNAFQAVPGDGKVIVATEQFYDDALETQVIAIRVQDNGPGIPEHLRERLFEPFVTSKTGGTGLGLPIVHRAAEAHGGTVLVEHLVEGTRFVLVVPQSQSVNEVINTYNTAGSSANAA